MSQRGEAVAAWESLFRAQVTVMRALAAEFPSREISLNEYDVMFNLTKQPGRRSRLRELNRHMLLTQPSVSRLVDRMVARELLIKENDPADGRGAVVVLTDAGYELFRRVAVSHMDSITSHVGGALNTEELAQLEALCDKLRLATNTEAKGNDAKLGENGAEDTGLDATGTARSADIKSAATRSADIRRAAPRSTASTNATTRTAGATGAEHRAS